MEKIRVIISNRQKQVRIPTGVRMLIRRCCHAVLQMEEFPDSAEISISFVDNEQIREMNRQYRDKDSVTDVLSFPNLEYETPGCFEIGQEQEADCFFRLLFVCDKRLQQFIQTADIDRQAAVRRNIVIKT